MRYRQLVTILQGALVTALHSSYEKINQIGKHPIGISRCTGVAVEIIPFHPTFAIHFRDSDDCFSIDFPAWKHWGLYDGREDQRELLEAVKREYMKAPDQRAYLLLLNTALADALLSEEVLEILQSHEIAKSYTLNELGNNPFTFLVLEGDESIRANLCDIIRWKRNMPKDARS